MIGKTHKSSKIIALALCLVPAVFGQINNFEFVQHDSAYVGSEEFVVLHGEIISLATSSQSISVTRVTHEMDTLWTNSFCVGPACLPPFLDNYTFDLAASDTAEFTLDTFPNGEEGIGIWTMFAVDSSTMEVDSVNIRLEFVAVSIDGSFERPNSFELSHIYPNPTNASINFDLDLKSTGDYSIILYALDGREIMIRNYQLNSGKNHLQWNMQGLPSGNYIISATGAGETISRQVSVIK
ncbi:MAG: T9SS type A sorting domain-containing protein [FCB group bacterium]|nr:T9SS type A sorting domain-containing protein [FCB group bacterium]MBL7027097.1 T9SS type A sorting domain-containing protein [Candidatus Neomarinimicrobiota bacterium]MBL7122411.1 T9SS type A sorting domain-containing protein [Candidatus Neomarinimicrobiota bacterium]